MAAEQLLVTEGSDRGTVLTVGGELMLGRVAPTPEGRLGGDPEMSRRHARIWREADGRLQIEDLGSGNGTFVNGARIDTPRPLNVGDVIRLGRTELKVTQPARDWSLVITAGNAEGREIVLGDELIIGRAATGDGRLGDDPKLSRRHARIARDPAGQFTIEDLDSANGTFVNGVRLHTRRVLNAGDSVEVGATALEVSTSEAASVPREPAPVPAEVVPEPAPGPRAPGPVRRAPAAPAPPPDVRLRFGSVFAGCRVEDVIGHGDMGVVYRAEELALRRPVALKLILSEYSEDERFRERFRRESKIAAAIDHPNVIPVFDAGEQDGVLYMMMRLVEGTDLRELIDSQGPVEPLRAARIVQQVGLALDAAHSRGMLHRDVKPSNVLIAARDHVYLTDFGLAKRPDAGDGLTRRGTVVARAEYVAPEQILNQHVDARADVYALACLLFEALTAEAPFSDWRGGAQPLAHLEAPRPSPRELRPDLPPEFDEVMRRGLATDPDERYPSAGDLGQAALVAAGGLRRARPWSVVATGEAAPVPGDQPAEVSGDGPAAAPDGASAGGSTVLTWVIALAGLVLVAAGMVGALIGISNL
ncbi:MAG: FHA domain-containing protein [Solirubrobacterales bacterium]|nr:FHA domain-containing protein [Solirubrobacterales bacterium]